MSKGNVSNVGRPPLQPMAITQIAIVVRDLRASLEAYHGALGWGPWNVYEHRQPTLHDTYLRGKRVEYSMLGAETHVGAIGVELLQPLTGDSIYKEWLDEHGEGLHHLAVMRSTPAESDATKRHFAEMGIAPLMGGRIGETIEFYYLDTQPLLKIIVESGTGHAVELEPAWTYPE